MEPSGCLLLLHDNIYYGMKDNTEYQIFIGCYDSQLRDEIVSGHELMEMVGNYFRKKEIDFSMYNAHGGFIYDDGSFVSENTLCINIIGAYGLDIIGLAKNLSMFMNQECALVVKYNISADYR